MTSSTSLTTVVATYRVQADRMDDFLRLLERHHPTLVELGLATSEPAVIYRGFERDGRPIVFEIFEWAGPGAPDKAHEHPDVMALWEPMGSLVEDRETGPKFDFPHVERILER